MKSPTSTIDSLLNSSPSLPAYLCNTEPMEPEAIPLQLALITMEVAEQRKSLAALADMLRLMASLIEPSTIAEITDT
jgi:hypothetical protein